MSCLILTMVLVSSVVYGRRGTVIPVQDCAHLGQFLPQNGLLVQSITDKQCNLPAGTQFALARDSRSEFRQTRTRLFYLSGLGRTEPWPLRTTSAILWSQHGSPNPSSPHT
ncbi:hypothetical protein R3P38DRAFT_2998445 [Favolaschia claudopus]|uniref:Uncharacterized protein n=1 Tax=Favolaschia claudopus TaxID=2862362 RepID=A0AAW0APE9_9AGAR